MSKQPVYGFPCVTDPNDFIPDYELCSPEDIKTHQRACETYGRPGYQPNKGCFTDFDSIGQIERHVSRTSWGIGTNLVCCCDRCLEPGDGLIVCHECHEQDFCSECWPKHKKAHDDGLI